MISDYGAEFINHMSYLGYGDDPFNRNGLKEAREFYTFGWVFPHAWYSKTVNFYDRLIQAPKKISEMTVEEFAGSDCPSIHDYVDHEAESYYEEYGHYPWEDEDHRNYEEPADSTYFTINEDNYTEEF